MSSIAPYSNQFYIGLACFHLFNLHAPLTLWVVDAPFGRFSRKSRFNVDGNISWCLMEAVAPVTFIITVGMTTPLSELSAPSKFACGMYAFHYLIRAFISPLLLSPTRAEQSIVIPVFASIFNLLNASLLGCFIARNPVTEADFFSFRALLGMAGWAAGLLGNVYHDEILHDLRRPSRVLRCLGISSTDPTTSGKPDNKTSQTGKYKIPKGGLFYWITFPNYTCEWFEWLSYALFLSPNPLMPVPASVSVFLSAHLPIGIIQHLPTRLLTPPWAFLLAEVTSMLPRAVRGLGWYKAKFGKEWEESGRQGGRWVVIPGLL